MGKQIRAVMAGCGGMSGAWLRSASEIPAVKIVGLVDIVADSAKKRADEFKLADAVIGTNLKAVIKQTGANVVFDCTTPEAHHPITMTALRNGCHVLGEKPLADSMAHAKAMVAAAKKAKKLYAVIQNRRYDQHIRRLKSFLESGAIGDVTTVHCDFYIGAHFGGFRDHMKHVLLLDMAIHTIDAGRFLIGVDPVAVTCREWNPPGSWYDHDASAVALFEMKGGIVYTYRGSWCADGLNTTWESDWRIICQQGSVKWNGADDFKAQVVSKTGGFFSEWADIEVPAHDAGDKTGGHTGIMKEFVRCIQSGGKPETYCADNIKSLAMVFGAIKSSEAKKRVPIKW
ncbi:MAG: Gfo/Idh/MocA family oxidoreductase [bacterium]